MAKWIIVVDDDTANLKMAGHILSKNNMRVTAFKSGSSFLEYVKENGMPDLVLLDIKMPVMDGFETLDRLRKVEQEKGLMKTPVVFLTADEDVETETRGFEVGVSDFIRKPFNPDVLLRRIDNIMSNSQEIHVLKNEATIDKLTGLLNKGATGSELSKMCSEKTGCLMMIDLDSFKLVNDIYGHGMGDKVIIACADIIRKAMPTGSKCGRIGGDEFVAFAAGITYESDVAAISNEINDGITKSAKELMGDDMSIPLGASIGGIFVPRYGNDYNALLKLADKSLYAVKKNGKHGYGLYDDDVEDESDNALHDIQKISEILGERSIQDVALQLDKDSFSPVYRYVIRYILRHRINACKVLITLSPADGVKDNRFYDSVDEFGSHIRESLRKSDIFMRNGKDQYFVFLTDIRADSIDKVISHLVDNWDAKASEKMVITHEQEFVGSRQELIETKKVKKVVVVDDDVINLQVAGKILSAGGIHVTALRSGEALFDYLDKENELPNLILLDVKMPGMSGFDCIKKLHSLETQASKIPVIFLTADESEGAEREGLSLGAMDFIRKPFVPEILRLRVNNLIELVTLQNQLYFEVEQKTRENKDLFMQIVRSLAAAIDTKDVHTKGHSSRVAEYSRMIAKRSGFPDSRQDEIYVLALLHDVGKIGIPDGILNKPSTLTDEEFKAIKAHSALGASILKNIENDPKFELCAMYHHERYDGTGYPSGLKGTEIPEEARIIAVADAYDAMSSDRSYRPHLSQEKIRSELENGKGTQFDPDFAEIMLSILDEDKDYRLRG
ncbi:diguanylate cyclase (GGDEF)-like protein [Ruminococcaceae bacterium R-25]|nr:diguanylate cyclase (GGDEF)-like protein [Ruminococcaceae bacterium R-25]SUQ22261.1 diguanylate cyclase (GGDEF) domain-containing protein [Oscillospiraceae bacterium]